MWIRGRGKSGQKLSFTLTNSENVGTIQFERNWLNYIMLCGDDIDLNSDISRLHTPCSLFLPDLKGVSH